jgi:hypothetical protein
MLAVGHLGRDVSRLGEDHAGARCGSGGSVRAGAKSMILMSLGLVSPEGIAFRLASRKIYLL